MTQCNIKADVSTICMGQACSMDAFLLSAVQKVNVFIYLTHVSRSTFRGGYKGQATDVQIRSRNFESEIAYE